MDYGRDEDRAWIPNRERGSNTTAFQAVITGQILDEDMRHGDDLIPCKLV
jgi:hypothetical protein